MPTYSYRCSQCERDEDVFCRISEMESRVPQCCERPMGRMIHPVAGYVQGSCNYVCPVTRQGVTSWKQRNEIMKRNRLIDANDFNTPSALAAAAKKQALSKKLTADQPEERAAFLN